MKVTSNTSFTAVSLEDRGQNKPEETSIFYKELRKQEDEKKSSWLANPVGRAQLFLTTLRGFVKKIEDGLSVNHSDDLSPKPMRQENLSDYISLARKVYYEWLFKKSHMIAYLEKMPSVDVDALPALKIPPELLDPNAPLIGTEEMSRVMINHFREKEIAITNLWNQFCTIYCAV